MLDVLQLSGSLPKNPRFREWVAYRVGPAFVSEEWAAQVIRYVCDVQSRRDLATNPEAARRFHELIRKPFVEWCEQLREPV